MTSVPVILPAKFDSPISHGQLQDLDQPDHHPWAAKAADLAALIADLGEADPFIQYLLRTDVGTDVPPLVDGLIPAEFVPIQPLANTYPVANLTELVGLSGAVRGDIGVVTDADPIVALHGPGTFILRATPPSVLGNWTLLPTPAGVLTVDGAAGIVTLPTDGPAGTGTKRTLGDGPQQASPGDHDHDEDYLLLDGTNVVSAAQFTALRRALGHLADYDGQELLVYGDSLPVTGGARQASRLMDRVGRQLGTIGRAGAGQIWPPANGAAVTIEAQVPDNGDHDVSFKINGAPAFTPGVVHSPGVIPSPTPASFPGITNYAIGGYRAAQILNQQMLSGTRAWVPGTVGLVVLFTSTNNYGNYSDSQSITAFGHCLRSECRFLRMRAASGNLLGLHNITGGAGGGTFNNPALWAVNAVNFTYGSNAAQTFTQGAFTTITWDGDEVLIGILHRDAGQGGGIYAIEDPTGAITYFSGPTVDGFAAGGALTYYTRIHRLAGFGPGTHSVRVRKTDPFTLNVSLDLWGTPRENPPEVLIVKPPDPRSGQTASWVAHMAVIDAIVAEPEFAGYVSAVDLEPGWDQASMSWDGVHFGDAGHLFGSERIIEHLATRPIREGLARLLIGAPS